MQVTFRYLLCVLWLQVDKYYLFHPKAKTETKGDSRLKLSSQEAEEWAEGLSELSPLINSFEI